MDSLVPYMQQFYSSMPGEPTSKKVVVVVEGGVPVRLFTIHSWEDEALFRDRCVESSVGLQCLCPVCRLYGR